MSKMVNDGTIERKHMKTNRANIIEMVAGRIVAAIRRTGDIVQAIANTVVELFTITMKHTEKACPSVTNATVGVGSGAVRTEVSNAAHNGKYEPEQATLSAKRDRASGI